MEGQIRVCESHGIKTKNLDRCIYLIMSIVLLSSMIYAVPPSPGYNGTDYEEGDMVYIEESVEGMSAMSEGDVSLQSTTTEKVLVIRVRFNDSGEPICPSDKLNNLTNYYEEVSCGKLNITTTITGSGTCGTIYNLNHPQWYYGKDNGSTDTGNFSGELDGTEQLIKDAINLADFDENFANYDKFIIVHPAGDQASTGTPGDIQTIHLSSSGCLVNVDGKCIKNAIVVSGNIYDPDKYGVYAHEYGHSIGLPDLYQSVSTTTAGSWSIMDEGAWDHVHPSPWAKVYKNWLTINESNTVLSNNDYILKPVENCSYSNASRVLKVPIIGEDVDEYYLVEVRKRIGEDVGLPTYPEYKEGVVIWRVSQKNIDQNFYVHEYKINHDPLNGLTVMDPNGGGLYDASLQLGENFTHTFPSGEKIIIKLENISPDGESYNVSITRPDNLLPDLILGVETVRTFSDGLEEVELNFIKNETNNTTKEQVLYLTVPENATIEKASFDVEGEEVDRGSVCIDDYGYWLEVNETKTFTAPSGNSYKKIEWGYHLGDKDIAPRTNITCVDTGNTISTKPRGSNNTNCREIKFTGYAETTNKSDSICTDGPCGSGCISTKYLITLYLFHPNVNNLSINIGNDTALELDSHGVWNEDDLETIDFKDEIQNVSANNCSCSGCNDSSQCKIPVVFHSNTTGTVKVSKPRVPHQSKPRVCLNVTPDGPAPMEISTKIANTGRRDTQNVKVKFLVDNTSIENKTLNDVFAGSEKNITFYLSTNKGLHNITIITDTDNEIQESDESNNNLTMLVNVTHCVDADNDTICDIVDDNCVGASNTNQSDFDNDSIGDACDIDSDDDGVNEWGGGRTDKCNFTPQNEKQDVDPWGCSCSQKDDDNDGVNNCKDNCLNIQNSNQSNLDNDSYGDACDFPDLTITAINFEKINLTEGENVTINVTVKNIGTDPANNVLIEVFQINEELNNLTYSGNVSEILNQSEIVIEFNWTVIFGIKIVAKVDPDGVIDEFDEGNNEKSKTVFKPCDLNKDGIVYRDWNDLMMRYKCHIRINHNCGENLDLNHDGKIFQDWDDMSDEYKCFVGFSDTPVENENGVGGQSVQSQDVTMTQTTGYIGEQVFAMSGGPPMLPTIYSGFVIIEGALAPNGTDVTAETDGVVYDVMQTVTMYKTNKTGYYFLAPQGGCCGIIEFVVDGRLAMQTASWSDGEEPVHLNLSIAEWWNNSWEYRIPVKISTDRNRYNTPIEVEVNFTEDVELSSIRVVEYYDNGLIKEETPSQYVNGKVQWNMEGLTHYCCPYTPDEAVRYYYIYFSEEPKSNTTAPYMNWYGETDPPTILKRDVEYKISGWDLPDRNYRKPITLDSTGNLTDYQVLITLNSTNFDFSKANSDGSDIRFIDGNKELNYWIEKWNSTESKAKVWVKVNLTETKEIYMYYGNPNAESKSNGTATFELFDDFEGTALDETIWNSSGNVSVADSKVTIQNAEGEIYSMNSYGAGYAIRGYGKLDDNAGYGLASIGFNNGIQDADTVRIYSHKKSQSAGPLQGYTKKAGTGGAVAMDEYESSNYRKWDIMWVNSSLARFRVDEGIIKGSTTNIPTGQYPVNLYSRYSTDVNEFDWILVRKYSSQEPDVSVGLEESQSDWWNPHWNYRKPTTLNSTGNLTDYQVLITLNSTNFDFNKANPDGSDTRFIDGNKEWNYWVEEWNYNNENAKVWVKVNLTGTKEIYMYYGNSNAESKSNGTETFELFDDFEGTALDETIWNSSGSVSVADSKVTIQNANGEIYSMNSYGAGYAIRGYGKLDDNAGYGLASIGFNNGIQDDDTVRIYSYGKSESAGPLHGYTKKAGTGGAVAMDENESSNYRKWDIMWVNSSLARFRVDEGIINESTTNIPTGQYPVNLYSRFSTDINEFDWILVRKYSSQEPDVSVGTEQVSSSSVDTRYNAVNLEIISAEIIENNETENKDKINKKEQKIKDNLMQELNETSDQNLSVIIKFKDNVTDFNLTKGNLEHEFKNLNAISVTLSPEDIEKLVNESYIESIELDVVVFSMVYESVPMLHIPEVHNLSFNGSGVKVAVLDTGVVHNETFNIGSEYDLVEDDNYSQDENGHGTHVSGIVAASAPGVEIMPVRVLDASGSGYASDVIAGIEWALENGADVISLSLGAPGSDGSSALSQAADNAANSGVVVVAAAGNDPSNIASPGDARDVVTVGAIDKSYNIAYFSGRGPTADGRVKPDLVAPGVNIYSYSLDGMESMSGTSQAVPFVSGISALLIQDNKTSYEIKTILMNAAVDLGYDVNTQGAGMVDAAKAFDIETGTGNETINETGNETTETEINNIKVLPGETIIYNFTVENIGETKDTFRIYTDGVPAQWINISNSVTVNAGGIKTEHASIIIPESMTLMENKTYNFTIYVIGKSRDNETVSITVLPTEQAKNSYIINEIENLKAEIELIINVSGNLTNISIDKEFGEEIVSELNNVVDFINKNNLESADKVLTGISNDLNEEKGRKISDEFAEYLIARVELIGDEIQVYISDI